MIRRLKGKVWEKRSGEVVLDCTGVGYGLSVSLNTLAKLGGEGSAVDMYVYTHVAEDSLRLFGFITREERAAFEVLIAISGVGPKLALAILSALSAKELERAVLQGDKDVLVRVPGVGKKKAERLLLDLKDKIVGPERAGEALSAATAFLGDEVSGALVNLGFSLDVAAHAAQGARQRLGEDSDIADLIKEALQIASKPGRG